MRQDPNRDEDLGAKWQQIEDEEDVVPEAIVWYALGLAGLIIFAMIVAWWLIGIPQPGA
jgi:hypothetical protein